MTTENDTFLNPFGDKDYTTADKYQEQVDNHNPTLQEVLQSQKDSTEASRLLTDAINTDYLD